MIDYKLLDDASKYYNSVADFKRIESPWLVTKEISDITKPVNCSSYIVKKDTEETEKVFVASGEQSLLYLINKGFFGNGGKFQTITPCMRNDSFDSTHTKYFIKLELMNFSTKGKMDIEDVDYIVYEALNFFSSFTKGKYTQPKIVSTGNDCFDIMYKDVEIGSYGLRHTSFCSWVYGTGIAEPRFSRILRSLV